MRCMNLEKDSFQSENMKLLTEILEHKINLRKLYGEWGPGSSDYISLSIKHDLLVKEYIEEKLLNLISISKGNILESWEQQ